MKKLTTPSYDLRLVRRLCRRVRKAILEAAVDTGAPKPASVWDSNSQDVTTFKQAITDELLVQQERKCAYCDSGLYAVHHHREHFVPKGKHPRWVLWPRNIVLSCYACNDRKGQVDTVETPGPSYRTTTFTIVHPFYDDPAEHFSFVPSAAPVLVVVQGASDKGRKTVTLFDLASPERSKERAARALLETAEGHLHGAFLKKYEAAIAAIASGPLVSKPLGGAGP